MFSSNEKISGRQAFRLLVFDLLGLGTLLIPTAVAGFCGRDGIFCIIAGTVAGILFLKLMVYAVGDMQGSFAEYTVNMCGTFFGKIIQAGYFLYLVLLAGYTAYLFSVTVLNNLLRGESFYLVLVLILGLVWYGLLSGIEGRARVYELLFWIILIPLFIMLASALDEVKTDYWNPVFFTERSDFFAGSYYVFICSSLIFLVLFLGGYLRKRESLMKAGRLALIFTGCLEAGLYLILLGVFGGAALSDMQTPAITLMSTIKITGGFLKRADAFMFGIWFFTLYALLNSAVFYAEMLLNGLYHAKKRQTLWKRRGHHVSQDAQNPPGAPFGQGGRSPSPGHQRGAGSAGGRRLSLRRALELCVPPSGGNPRSPLPWWMRTRWSAPNTPPISAVSSPLAGLLWWRMPQRGGMPFWPSPPNTLPTSLGRSRRRRLGDVPKPSSSALRSTT